MTDIASFLPAARNSVPSPQGSLGGDGTPLAHGLPAKQDMVLEGGNPDKAALRDAAEAFEAVFLRQMIGSMRSASLGEDLLGNNAGEQFRDMADDRVADNMAEQNSFGIAEMLLKQFGVDETAEPKSFAQSYSGGKADDGGTGAAS